MLLDHFIALKYSPTQLEVLNRCHIYLQVLSLAAITSADGKQIIIPTLSGHILIDRRSTLKWPVEQRPPPSEWALWSSVIQHLHRQGPLIQPLSSWLSKPHQSWFWYMDPTTSTLYYTPEEGTWLKAMPLEHQTGRRTRSFLRRFYSKSQVQPSNEPPSNIVPASISEDLTLDLIISTAVI
jgi:hypothetical protein